MARSHGMTSEQASEVKRSGHRREHVFARLIGAEVIRGTRKVDVERDGFKWSVKGAEWAQIFLYGPKKASELGQEFRECLDVFPEKHEDYLSDKKYYKELLEAKMRILCAHLEDEDNLETFLYKGMFDDSIDFLAIEKSNGQFLEFRADEVVEKLVEGLTVVNSRGDQKVVFYLEGIKAALGEIEVRNDPSGTHYRELKCRFNVPRLTKFLEARCTVNKYLV